MGREMRSFFIEGIDDRNRAVRGLSNAFPEQEGDTKVLFGLDRNRAIAYLYVGEPDDPEEQLGPFIIQADVSGRFQDFDADERVAQALRSLQAEVGGVIRDDDGTVL